MEIGIHVSILMPNKYTG